MDNEDMLFNLMYFGEAGANVGHILDAAREETVAMHSANNT